MKTVEEFVKELEKDPAKTDALKQLKSKEEVNDFMQKEGISGTAEELGHALKPMTRATNELTDNELSEVTGGKIEWGDSGIVEDMHSATYQFKIDDRVEVWHLFGTKRGTISRVYLSAYYDWLMRERFRPIYDVKLDAGGYDVGVYQNDLSY